MNNISSVFDAHMRRTAPYSAGGGLFIFSVLSHICVRTSRIKAFNLTRQAFANHFDRSLTEVFGGYWSRARTFRLAKPKDKNGFVAGQKLEAWSRFLMRC